VSQSDNFLGGVEMKNFLASIVVVIALVAIAGNAQAQCGSRAAVVVGGFGGFAPQAVVVPQSTAFFSGGNVAFVNTPQAFFQPSFVASPFVGNQQINIRRGALGRVRQINVRSSGAAALNIGRSTLFIR
jgi:hypothetical protein